MTRENDFIYDTNDPCVLHHKRDGTEESKIYWIEVGNLPPEETEEFIRSMMRSLRKKHNPKNVTGDYMLPEKKSKL